MSRGVLVSLVLLSLTATVSGQPAAGPLTVVDDIADWPAFRAHCRDLLASLEKLSAPLPADTIKSVKALLDSEPRAPRQAIVAIQKLLDPHCLVGVHINPEIQT